ncbi:hypothetical protein L211DRAFT_836066 [Terfezia boudieri ATCC MYA-4762]|uniref:Uncharacterized protein n=1 Tax=Terfezia boudieri ATCC MYA-4762 TaxID=1051890 RepID=A0A3N4LSU3_9PEZI|nr:hypothetical protein L211DRAFT_836066 [Terfezia boudieri ATCC MYA-4762]
MLASSSLVVATLTWVSPRDFLLGQAFSGPNFNFAVFQSAPLHSRMRLMLVQSPHSWALFSVCSLR